MARRSQPDRGAFTGQKLGIAGGVVISASSALCSIAPAASLAVPTEAGGYCRPGACLLLFGFVAGLRGAGCGQDAREKPYDASGAPLWPAPGVLADTALHNRESMQTSCAPFRRQDQAFFARGPHSSLLAPTQPHNLTVWINNTRVCVQEMGITDQPVFSLTALRAARCRSCPQLVQQRSVLRAVAVVCCRSLTYLRHGRRIPQKLRWLNSRPHGFPAKCASRKMGRLLSGCVQ